MTHHPLLVVIAYHNGDVENTKNLLDWIKELGGCDNHACLLAGDSKVSKEVRKELLGKARLSFPNASSIPVEVPAKGFAPNHMFLAAAMQIQPVFRWPWFWLEPDALPLKVGWLDALSFEYYNQPRKFLGPLIESDQPGLPTLHLTGCSIYPPDTFSVFQAIKTLQTENVAWDIESASIVVPRAMDTKLIQHFYGTKELPPTFIGDNEPAKENSLKLDFIRPSAVVFHRNKDGSLLKLLREKRSNPVRRGRPPKSVPTPVPTPTHEIVVE